MESRQNRRSAERIQMQIPVSLNGTTGQTRDISGHGVYFTSDEMLQVGSQVMFWLELAHALPDKHVRVKCRGRVVRVDSLGQQSGIAATIERFSCIH
ncbi:MAG: PilZ domain-containing protein [Desulfuromonadales bacterium]|nr:PilZ domain-containing protein [Desulfuromonadales bacterium]